MAKWIRTAFAYHTPKGNKQKNKRVCPLILKKIEWIFLRKGIRAVTTE
jgi:hypothetical protein